WLPEGRGAILPSSGDSHYPLSALSTVVRPELLLQRPLKVAALRQLLDDVGAADQLAADEDLWDRRPARDRGQFLADPGVGQNVDGGDRCPGAPERLECTGGVTAHDELGGALHEQGDVLGLDHVLDLLAKLAH